MLLVAAYSDWRYSRIPNKVVFFGLCAALVVALLEAMTGGSGAWSQFGDVGLGLAAGFFLCLPFHLLRLLGAGDVKLLAVVGGFLGWPAIAQVLVLSLLLNGLMSVLIALRHGVLRSVLSNVGAAFARAGLWVTSGGAPRDAVQVEVSGYRMPHALGVALAVLVYAGQRFIGWPGW